MGWTLKYGDTTKAFKDWGYGLAGLHKRTISARCDEVTFQEDGIPHDIDPTFPYDAEITIYRDDVQWFVGRVMDPRRKCSEKYEGMEYTVRGVMYWAELLIFRQPWKFLTDRNNPDSDKFTAQLSDIILFQKLDGNISSLATVREQVQEIFFGV